MSKKQPHVPETREPRPNRAERRHPEKVDSAEGAQAGEGQVAVPNRGTEEEVSVRAKSSGHKKKTADKWNQ